MLRRLVLNMGVADIRLLALHWVVLPCWWMEGEMRYGLMDMVSSRIAWTYRFIHSLRHPFRNTLINRMTKASITQHFLHQHRKRRTYTMIFSCAAARLIHAWDGMGWWTLSHSSTSYFIQTNKHNCSGLADAMDD